MTEAQRGDSIRLLSVAANDRESIINTLAMESDHVVSDRTDGKVYFWHNGRLLFTYHGAYEVVTRVD